MKRIYSILIIICMFSNIFPAMGTSYTWTGNTSTAWNTTSNWSPSGVPGIGDYVTISASGTYHPVLTSNITINGISISGGTVDLNGDTLLLSSGASSFGGGTISNGLVQMRGTDMTFSSTVFDATIDAVVNRINLNGGTFNNYCYFETTTNVPGTGSGGAVFNDSVYLYHNYTGAGIWVMNNSTGHTFNGKLTIYNKGTKEITFAGAGINVFNGDIVLINTGAGGIMFGNDTLTAGHTMSIGSGGFSAGDFNATNFYQSGNTPVTLTFTGTALPSITGATFGGDFSITSNVLLFKNCTFYGTAAFTATGSGSSNWYGGNKFYGNATFTNNASAGNLRLDADTANTYYANATFNGSRELRVCYGNYESSFYGNITTGSLTTFNAGTGTLCLAGSGTQSLSFGGSNPVKNLKLNKSGGSASLASALAVTGSITFAKGNLTTSSSNLLTINNGGSVLGASDSSFIDGPVKKIGNAAFVFPTGKGHSFRAIEISAPSNTTDAFTGEYFNTGQTLGTSMESPMKFIDNCNYWNLSRNSGSSTPTLQLSWGLIKCALFDSTKAKVANWNGSTWKNLGNGGITGNRNVGNIANSAGVITFGNFTLGFDSCMMSAYTLSNKDTAKARAVNGTAPFTYLWSVGGTDSIKAGLSPSTIYTVTITDASGCSASATYYKLFSKVTGTPMTLDSNNSYYAGWADFDNDNDLDLFHSLHFAAPTNTNGNNFLFQNNCNGNFSRVSNIPGGMVTDGLTGTYSNWVDFDDDGDFDMYAKSIMYRNKGNGSFEKVTDDIKLNTLPMYSGANPRDIAFADYNNDGRLDAYTGHTHLYTGSGSGSSRDFDETTPTSFSGVSNSNRSDCISWVDYNNDGLMDIFVTNSNGTTTNYLYRNDGGGVFTSVTSTPDLVASQNSYGCAWGDIDNDGDMDVWVSNANVADRLFLNNGDGTFTRVTSGPVVTDHAANQAGAEWADYDNDGDLDLFVPAFNTNYLFDNNGDGTFTRNITEIPATDLSVESYGAAWADFDNDGDLDLFVPTGYGNPNDLFYLNNANPSETSNRNYLKLVCVGVTSNKSAIGARVYVKANVNGNNIWQMREINGNSTRGGNNGGVSGRVVHFGLGDATQIDSLKIVWPASSTEQVFLNVHVNKFARVFENDNTLHDIVPCTCDLPGSGLGYVSGRIYHDTNEDCVYDPGIDVPIVNKYVQAEPGAYFTLTNDSGVYTLDLPPGNYDISTNFYEDNWYLSSCQTDSLIYTTSVLADTIHDIDFSEQARIRPCQGAYIINTTSIGIVQGPCDDGLILTSPCQTFNHQYCFTVTNNSTLPSAAGTVMNITFPPGYIVLGTATNLPPCFVSETHTSNTANITLNVLNPGDICTVCLIVTVGGSAPFSTTFDYINPGGVVNLIVDGSFESGLVNFNSDAPYNLNCTAPTTQSDYCIGNTPWTMNGGFQNPLPAADGTLYLYADGSITANSRIWWQVVPVQANTRYTFSGAFCNVNIANIPNLTAPNMSLSVNGTPPIATTGPLAPGGNWNQAAGTWCSPATGTATLEIMSSVVALFGNDFGIDNLVFIENEARPFILLETDTCGCDPNDKMVTPKGCGENGNIEKNQKLNYKVRFENTGTGNAHDIVIRDEIDSDLDLPTLEILGASHTITNVQIIPDTALIITLGGIELEPDSSGFIAFNISPKQGLDDGTQITNQAGIYFDNNEVVVTNVTLNTVYDIPEPDAAFSYDHDCVSTGMVYDFEYTGNTPDNATFAWTFTDGTPSTSSSQNPDNITFSSAGYKYVTLTVSRNGCTNAVYDTILVKDYVINNELVIICHGEEVDTILISTLETHLSHGDCVGECDGAGSRIAQSEPVIKTEKPFEVNVKPNPANESCIVSVLGTNSGDHLCLELISFTGYVARVIYNDVPEKNMAPLLQTSVDLSNITSGFYLLKVQYGAEVKLIKLIVQH